MKKKSLKFSVCSILLLIMSCNEPETVVTNYIQRDGSITRVIEMRSLENKFELSDIQVPFDSTWSVFDTIEILDLEQDGKPDTIWVKKVERTFAGVDEINQLYRNDSSYNGKCERSASIEKKFRWFNTEFRFSENIESLMKFGLPIGDYLTAEEMTFFFSPDFGNEELKDGSDSLRIRALRKSIDEKTDEWLTKSIISEWIGHFGMQTAGRGTEKLIKDLNDRSQEIYDLISEKYEDKFDSLWEAGVIQKEILGEDTAKNFSSEADSAMSVATSRLLLDVSGYSVRMVMPGNLTGTNGYIDSTRTLIWPVSQEYFLTRPYEMWAESKVTNVWAWVVSGVFLLFVLTGIIIRTIKKG